MILETTVKTTSRLGQDDQPDKLFIPSAERNCEHICDAIKAIAPDSGDALEIASGTGQHIVTFAAAMPNIQWHPTEIDATRRKSIEAYSDEAGLQNISPPTPLYATQKGWGETIAPKTLITLANLLHLITGTEAETLISEVSKALTPNGKFFLYGPFKRTGNFISEGDLSFDASIKENNPEAGYKDDAWIKLIAIKNGLILDQAIEMPANNLAFVFRKPLTHPHG